MIKAKRKPFEEIKSLIARHDRVLVAGCGGCVSVCYAGGLKETGILKDQLAASFLQDGDGRRRIIATHTVERQCNMTYVAELDEVVRGFDAVLSMACGAGVQYLAERYPNLPVYPAVNTLFIGVDRQMGLFEERCRACGDCVLGFTGGICPVTRCAKSLFNGPCGGTSGGFCEVGDDIPCAWKQIHERLTAIGQMDNILKIHPPMQWRNTKRGMFVQEGQEWRFAED